MRHWIFISSPKQFRMDDWLSCNEYVEFVQRNKVQVNDYNGPQKLDRLLS